MTALPVVSVVVLSIALFACGFDLRTRRIPNWLTLGSALSGLVFHTVTGGVSGGMHSLEGCAAGMLLLLVPYALGGLGAGDVKLLGALGAWLWPGDTFWLAMYTCMAGAVMALIVSLWHGYLRQAWSNVWLVLMHWRVSGLKPLPQLTLATSQGPRLAYAAPILVGTIVVLWLR
jgi:prepilin peptidase CpaA